METKKNTYSNVLLANHNVFFSLGKKRYCREKKIFLGKIFPLGKNTGEKRYNSATNGPRRLKFYI